MGNNSSSNVSFNMDIYLIGDNIKEFHTLMEELKQNKNKLESYWTFYVITIFKQNIKHKLIIIILIY